MVIKISNKFPTYYYKIIIKIWFYSGLNPDVYIGYNINKIWIWENDIEYYSRYFSMLDDNLLYDNIYEFEEEDGVEMPAYIIFNTKSDMLKWKLKND